MPLKKRGKTISNSKADPRLIPLRDPPSAKIVRAVVSKDSLDVWINDGRFVSTPLSWYPTLKAATPQKRKEFRIFAAGFGLEWESLDYHLDLEGMLAGKKEVVRRSHATA
jgi:hypothetical protein